MEQINRPRGEVALRIQLYRAGMTQRELADQLGISDRILSDYVRGRRPIPLERRIAMAGALGCDMATLGWA